MSAARCIFTILVKALYLNAEDAEDAKETGNLGKGAALSKAMVLTTEISEDTHRRASLAQGRLRKAKSGGNRSFCKSDGLKRKGRKGRGGRF